MPKNTVRVIVAGSRNITDYNFVKKKLTEILNKEIRSDQYLEIVHGDCKGADKLGDRFADKHNIPKKVFPADWQDLDAKICVVKYNKYGPYNVLAGKSRNQKMADYAKEANGILIAFTTSNSSGTYDMIQRAKDNNLKIYEIKDGINYENKNYK